MIACAATMVTVIRCGHADAASAGLGLSETSFISARPGVKSPKTGQYDAAFMSQTPMRMSSAERERPSDMHALRPSVYFVSRKWPPAMGGMETYSLRLSQELKRHADVETIVLPGNADGSVPGAGALLAFGVRTAARLLFSKAAEVVQIADMASWPLGLVARIRAPRSRIVLTAHGTDVSYAFGPTLRQKLYRLYMRACALCFAKSVVICNSEATCDMVRALGFTEPRRVVLGSDIGFQAAAGTSKRILFAGRLIPSKGCRWFVENVLSSLPEGVELDVAGTCTDPQESQVLHHPRVNHLGNLSQETLARRFSEALCVVVPNIEPDDPQHPSFEGFGLVAAEAASAGGVVLAAYHSGLRDAVIDGKTGFHLPSGDAQAWIAKINEVIAWSTKERTRFKRHASEQAQAHYNWARVAQETFDAYG